MRLYSIPDFLHRSRFHPWEFLMKTFVTFVSQLQSAVSRTCAFIRPFSLWCIAIIICAQNVQQSAAQDFGRIHPQYQTFTWQNIESRSFDVYHTSGNEYLAQYAAAIAEDVLKTGQRTLGFSLNERLPIIVTASPGDAAQVNAARLLLPRGLIKDVTELRKNIAIVPFRGDWFQFRRELRQEIVSSMLTALYFGTTLPSPLTGQGVMPVWFTAGLANFVAAEGLDTETDMVVRDLILSEQFTSLNALEGAAKVRVGHMLFWYIAEKFGSGKITELLTRARGLGSVESAFRSTFGVSVDGFSNIWRRDLKEIYAQDASKYEDVEKIATRITDAGKDGSTMNTGAVYAPNADKIAFLSSSQGGGISGIGGANATSSVNAGTWSVMLYDGRQKRTDRLLSTGRMSNALSTTLSDNTLLAWNPAAFASSNPRLDGSQLAAVVAGSGTESVVLLTPANGAQQRLEMGFKQITGITFASDGKSLLLTAAENESPNLYSYDIAAKKLTKLTNDVFTEREPVASPDGKTVYFVSDRLHTLSTNTSSASVQMWDYNVQSSDVYAMTLATKRIERLTSTPQLRKTALALTPDGKRLLFTADYNGVFNLMEYSIATRTTLPKSNVQTGIWQPSLSRDGGGGGGGVSAGAASSSKLAFTSFKKGVANVYTMPSPLERKFTTAPEPTELRRQELERESAANKALGRSTVPSGRADAVDSTGTMSDAEPAEEKPSKYGKFEVNFDNQKMVEPNPELAARVAVQQAAVEASDFTTPGSLPVTSPLPFELLFDSWNVEPTFDTYFGSQLQTGEQSFLGNVGLSAQAVWKDVVGNNRLMVWGNVMFNYVNNDIFASYSYLPELIDYEASIFRSSRVLYVLDPQLRDLVPSRLTYWGVAAKAMLPLNSTMRLEGKLTLLNGIREGLGDRYQAANRSDFSLIPEARFVMDNSENAFFGGTVGSRGFAKVDAVPGMAGQSFVRLIADYRQYIPVKNFFTVAARASVGTNLGSTPQNFILGGQENAIVGRTFGVDVLPFVRAEDLYLLQAVTPIRGVPIASAQGRSFAAINAEVRVNLLAPDAATGFLSNLIGGLQGVVFADVGAVWNTDVRLRVPRQRFDVFQQPAGFEDGDLLMSVGLGLRTFLLGQYPLKIDVAFQNLQTGLSEPRFIIGFGYNF
jgi:WD40-like Beta Propeller Repeat